MIDRLVVHVANKEELYKELNYLKEFYQYKLSIQEEKVGEIVFQTYSKRVNLYQTRSTSYINWDSSARLPSFQDIPKLRLLQSIGLSDKEIQEYFPWWAHE